MLKWLGGVSWKLSKLLVSALTRGPLDPETKVMWESIKETCKHYWVNTKLLAADFRTGGKLVRKVLSGRSLTR